jgi:hypothetical protein
VWFYPFGRVMRKYSYILVLVLVLVLVLAIALIAAFSWPKLKQNRMVTAMVTRAIRPKPAHMPMPPPMEALGQGARPPTAQELEQEKNFNAQQAGIASQWLKSPDAQRRTVGAEQLSAYESPVSEQCLTDALRRDTAPEVRKAAAQSLSAFKNLSDHAVTALLEALGDANESARIAALNTLMTYTLLVSADTKKYGQLLAKLQKKLRSGHLNNDVSGSLQAFIEDQEPLPPLPSQAIEVNK